MASIKLVVVVGETASGKSALAIGLAKQFNGEIIAADSWTVRREVNIGTAKPIASERAEIPHYLLDIVSPCQDFTAAVFKDLANQAIKDIAGKNKLPIMVGGTGLYIDSVLYDFKFLPVGDRMARQELDKYSTEELVKLIKAKGYDLEGIDVNNKRRLIRVIESAGEKPQKGELRRDTLLIGLKIDPVELKSRINARVEDMIKNGLEKEVKTLSDKYGWDCEALKGIGYKEWQPYFENRQTLDEVKAKIIKNTADLAKRQRTWFKRNKSIQWVSSPLEAITLASHFLNNIHTN